MDDLYSINDVARKLGISISTIRKYEQDYSLNIMRNESNNRVYTDNDIEVLKKIIELKKEGANIHLIRKFLLDDGSIEQLPEVIEERSNLHTQTIELLKNDIANQVADIIAAKEEKMRVEFGKILDEKLEQQENKIRQQIQAENQKLIDYIDIKRSEKKSIWSRILGR